MRKITQEAVRCFIEGKSFSKDNTSVNVFHRDKTLSSWKKGTKEMQYYSSLLLHNNHIATLYSFIDGSVQIEVSTQGWFSNTTKERLNGIPGVSIVQKKGIWYLNGQEWDGGWINV